MKTAKTIMIVDDDEDDIDFFNEAVRDIDPSLRCITAGDGEEALFQLRHIMNTLPNCVFLDLNMPRMNGTDFLQELKRDHALNHIPVIIYTTSSHHKEKEETLRLGAAYFLTKAATFNLMRTGIEKILKLVFSIEKSAELNE